jgi:hypothetical protein
MVRVWLLSIGTGDMLVEVFGDAGDIPDDDLLYSETISDGDYTFTFTGDSLYGYLVYEVEIPIGGYEISPGTMYWLSLQHQGGMSIFWCAATHQYDWWDYFALYYGGAWMSGSYCGTDSFFELHGSTGPLDEEDPTVTDMYPLDDDFPSGVPPSENTSGCHWRDGDPETNKGIDVENSEFTVYDPDDEVVAGMLDIDDADLWDVVVGFEAEGATYTVETETYDLAGNSANETWDFTTGYVNVAPASLGVIKAGFIE